MASRGILKLHISILLALIIALAVADDSVNESAGWKDLRTARCEHHHDHDEKPPSKWLGKFKKTKYGPSKSQHRPKSQYGQPDAHFRPPPQYVRIKTNYNIPPYNPPAALPPPTSYPHHPANPSSFPQYSYAPVKFYGSPPQVQSFNRPGPPPIASTEAPVPPTYSNAPPYSQESEEQEDPEDYSPPEPVHNPPTPYSVPQVQVSSASYDPVPSPNYLKIADPDPPATNSSLVSTEATINHTSSYSDTPHTQTYSLPTVTHDSQDAAKQEEFQMPYSSSPVPKAPTNDPSTYSSPVSTEVSAFQNSESETPPAAPAFSSTPASYLSSDTPSYDPSTYSPPVTEAPDDFPPSLNDDYSQSYDDPYPSELPASKPASYSPPKFPSYNAPSYSTSSFFMGPPVLSPPTYSDHPFRKANDNRPSAKKPDTYNSSEDDIDEDEEGFYQNRDNFPRFNEFIQQMMRKGKK